MQPSQPNHLDYEPPLAAMDPVFFQRSRRGDRVTSLEPLIREWFPVTRAFCLAVQRYTGVLAEECWKESGRRRDELENALLEAVSISAGELGCGIHGIRGIHYHMFARLGERLGISLDELEKRPTGDLPETRSLIADIREAMQDPYKGAGCLRVVEGTAFNIVEAMDFLFRQGHDETGKPLFQAGEREYIDLHLELEKEHDEMTSKFVRLLSNTTERAQTIEASVETIGLRFAEFWRALEVQVFAEQEIGSTQIC